MTYTLAILELPMDVHRLIKKKLIAAGYGHAIEDNVLDMTHIGLAVEQQVVQEVKAKPVAKVRFRRDMEDGWYQLETPDGRVVDFDFWHDVKLEIKKHGWRGEWVGDISYRPTTFAEVEE